VGLSDHAAQQACGLKVGHRICSARIRPSSGAAIRGSPADKTALTENSSGQIIGQV
jgi:hypothetical protein